VGRRNPQAHPFVVPVEWGEEIEGPAGDVLGGSEFFEIPVTEISGAYTHLKGDGNPSIPSAVLSAGRCRAGCPYLFDGHRNSISPRVSPSGEAKVI